MEVRSDADVMGQIDEQRERERLAELDAGMEKGELEEMARDADSLNPVAREALRAEMLSRGMEAPPANAGAALDFRAPCPRAPDAGRWMFPWTRKVPHSLHCAWEFWYRAGPQIHPSAVRQPLRRERRIVSGLFAVAELRRRCVSLTLLLPSPSRGSVETPTTQRACRSTRPRRAPCRI